ncbi:hypothetical protein PF010_g11977 [Phytophthora fragariae]|uniref:Uncharacterized protein n=2 Tax=Phytophthora fragariae TaxID=53985 RepID=A0A6A3S258_9STRA|nr:hypothetical protein PF011_g11775 [Phytophthora fragariae]KAE9107854.1 hypothetical protein PF007_g12876 [Phytophthora fragariae]KAE9108248.1 hypothetical protein PF010_g11977 [Phytophthora fragariae]KAE9226920.1 hypothetical protein PF004_g11504 [Phytophthora fragariae]KAE9306739.1 hypothetical protein PF001_g11969 [Phytophthora fragariae]
MSVRDPYRKAFDRCGGGGYPTLDDQQWARFLDLLVDASFLSDDLAQRFKREHEGELRSFESFQRDLSKWSDTFTAGSHVDSIIDDLKKKTQFLGQVVNTQRQTDPIEPNFLQPVVKQAEALRVKLAELEEITGDTLASKWVQADFSASDDVRPERACPWKFQHANARYLRVEDRQRARYQLQLHQCDENTDRVLKETFYPGLLGFREVQVGMATLVSRKQNTGDDDEDNGAELAIVMMVRRQSASEEALLWLDSLVSAYRQLSLSPYVQQYLGSEDVAGTKQEAMTMEDVTTRHYFEFVQARSLSEMLSDDGFLLETSSLFKLYAHELLLVLIDLLEQSIHQLNTRILPENVMISHSGRRLFLGKLDFGDYIDPFQNNSLSEVMEKREGALLEDLSVIIFSMLYPVTLPRNLNDFRSQYLACRDDNFVFNDTFAIVLSGDNVFDEMWSCRVSSKSVLACVNCHYSPMEFHFLAKSKGESTIFFEPMGNYAAGAFSVPVKVCRENFRLHESKVQILISVCAAGAGSTSAFVPHASPRMLLEHEIFQALSTSESHQVERELLERV